MKKFIINKCMNYIKKNTNYNEIKLEEIKYGLVSIYLTISKMLIISIISLILGIFKEMITFSLIYNILRFPSFGLHATKSWICLIISAILFIGIPYLSIILNIPITLKIIICIFGIYLMFKNAPADTQKKPIINKKKRMMYKLISTTLAIIYSIIIFLIKDKIFSNYLLISLILQNIMISPITYKIFKLPYNNYITYLEKHPEFSN